LGTRERALKRGSVYDVLVLVECKHCGAPLDVNATASIVRCSYCGANSRVRSMKTLAPHAPSGWAPPQQWQPTYAAAPLPYLAPPKQTSIRTLVLVIVAIVLVTSLCPLLFIPFFFLPFFR
jgi:LSD1 subclass zinc finger protein